MRGFPVIPLLENGSSFLWLLGIPLGQAQLPSAPRKRQQGKTTFCHWKEPCGSPNAMPNPSDLFWSLVSYWSQQLGSTICSDTSKRSAFWKCSIFLVRNGPKWRLEKEPDLWRLWVNHEIRWVFVKKSMALVGLQHGAVEKSTGCKHPKPAMITFSGWTALVLENFIWLLVKTLLSERRKNSQNSLWNVHLLDFCHVGIDLDCRIIMPPVLRILLQQSN